MNKVHFSSEKHDWRTPPELFKRLDEEFNFELDAAANASNTLCTQYLSPEDDALNQEWTGNVYVNPPFGYGLHKWVEKARTESAKHGNIVVMLIPARTDTRYWHDHVMKAQEVRLIKGRLNFKGGREKGHNAPFPCAVVIFDGSIPVECARFISMERPEPSQ